MRGVGHPGLVDHDQGRRPNPPGPVGQVVLADGPGEFGEGVGVGVDLVAELRGGGRYGASPITVPPASVQAAARVCIAVVLPVPAGAIASCSRAPRWPSGGPTPPARRSG